MAQLKDLIVNGPSRFIGSVQASADPVQNMELATKQYVDNATEDLYDSTSVSASWTNGTTNGPTLKITVNDVEETATIPGAGASQSGVITTGNQYISGTKIFYNSPQVPTAGASSNDTTAASTAFVYNAFKVNDAMVFMGLADPDDDNYPENEISVLALGNKYSKGYTYRASRAGIYAGQSCEQNDLIIAVEDNENPSNTLNATINNSHWIVVQTNIDGAVVGPLSSSSLDNCVAIFNGSSGKSIKGSQLKITTDNNTNIDTLEWPGNEILTGELTLENGNLTLENGNLTLENQRATITVSQFTFQPRSLILGDTTIGVVLGYRAGDPSGQVQDIVIPLYDGSYD